MKKKSYAALRIRVRGWVLTERATAAIKQTRLPPKGVK